MDPRAGSTDERIKAFYNDRDNMFRAAGGDPQKYAQQMSDPTIMKKYAEIINKEPKNRDISIADVLPKVPSGKLHDGLKFALKVAYDTAVANANTQQTFIDKYQNKPRAQMPAPEVREEYGALITQRAALQEAQKMNQLRMPYAGDEARLAELTNRQQTIQAQIEKTDARLRERGYIQADNKQQQSVKPAAADQTISLAEAQKRLADAKRFFPAEVKDAQAMVDKIKAGEQVRRGDEQRLFKANQSSTPQSHATLKSTPNPELNPATPTPPPRLNRPNK